MTTKELACQVFSLDPLVDPRWSGLAASHPSASVFHSVGWLNALQKTYGYEPLVYTNSPEHTPLSNGIIFCRVKSWLTGRRLVSLPFSDHCEPLVDSVEELNELLGPGHQGVWGG